MPTEVPKEVEWGSPPALYTLSIWSPKNFYTSLGRYLGVLYRRAGKIAKGNDNIEDQ